MREWLTVLMLVAFLATGADQVAASPILSLDSRTGTVGESVDFALRISGLGSGTALGTFDLTLAFDPAILGFAAVLYGDPVLGDQLNLQGFGTITRTTLGVGNVELFGLSLDSSDVLSTRQADSFILAILTFSGLAAGQTPLGISIVALGDQFGRSFGATTQNGSVTVSPAVPEPASLFLLGSGLVGLVVAGYRCRQRLA